MSLRYEHIVNPETGKFEVMSYDTSFDPMYSPEEDRTNDPIFREDVELAFAATYDEYINYWLPRECTAAEALQIWVDISERTLRTYYDLEPDACHIWWELELETGLIEAPEVY